jgi:hypothetical protein
MSYSENLDKAIKKLAVLRMAVMNVTGPEGADTQDQERVALFDLMVEIEDALKAEMGQGEVKEMSWVAEKCIGVIIKREDESNASHTRRGRGSIKMLAPNSL